MRNLSRYLGSTRPTPLPYCTSGFITFQTGLTFMGFLALIGSVFTGLFGLKQTQGTIIQSVVGAVQSASTNEASEQGSKKDVVVAEATSQFAIAAIWRPLLMLFFAFLIGMRWFGFMPPNMTEAEIMRLYDLLTVGIGGYIGGRTFEKIVDSIQVGKIVNKFIDGKLSKLL